MRKAVKLIRLLRRGEPLDLELVPQYLAGPLAVLEAAARGLPQEEFDLFVADAHWHDRQGRLAAAGIGRPEFTRPSVAATPEGRLAAEGALAARRAAAAESARLERAGRQGGDIEGGVEAPRGGEAS
jgi:hypothetical protein